MLLEELQAAVRQAAEDGEPLFLSGADTKSYLGYPTPRHGRRLSVSGYQGIIEYYPEELVVRVRAGTPVSDLVAELNANGQMLAFDPPDHGGAATIGGVLSAGLSGSRRPFAGSVRDFVLGIGLVAANGGYHEFGGQVMKNVAGYDVSRLVCGSFGTLGLVADVSLKVLPLPETETSVGLELPLEEAREQVSTLMSSVTSLSGCCYVASTGGASTGRLMLRFSGSEDAVDHAVSSAGGEQLADDIWRDVDTQNMTPVSGGELWRLSTDPQEPIEHPFAWLDWCFGQRWLLDPLVDPRSEYRGAGHWTRYCAQGVGTPFCEPSPGLMPVHRRLKQAFDPSGLFNPGRMYQGL